MRRGGPTRAIALTLDRGAPPLSFLLSSYSSLICFTLGFAFNAWRFTASIAASFSRFSSQLREGRDTRQSRAGNGMNRREQGRENTGEGAWEREHGR